jgi:hypothetical protein
MYFPDIPRQDEKGPTRGSRPTRGPDTCIGQAWRIEFSYIGKFWDAYTQGPDILEFHLGSHGPGGTTTQARLALLDA